MKNYTILFISLLFILYLSTGICALPNELTISNSTNGTPKPGFIDKAAIVIEPHGGYVEQSLYLEYSDHNQFPYQTKLEIIHRFELPKGAVVNDMWLWINDKVMQARVLKTWSAKKTYDSIVAARRDPAILFKKGDQYELRVFPLTSGSIRKVKINFISPTVWSSNQAYAELPFKMLNCNNAYLKPLDVLFRTTQPVWGTPTFNEFPDQFFTAFKDTLNYQFKYMHLDNIAFKNKLSLQFQTNFLYGYFYGCSEVKNDYTYYQLGILPAQFFDVKPNPESKKILIGLDFSGKSNSDYTKLYPDFLKTVKSALKANDTFNVYLSGAGMMQKIFSRNLPALPQYIDSACYLISQSKIVDTLGKSKLIKVLFCDSQAEKCWGFPSFNLYANYKTTSSLAEALDYISSSDAVAAYSYGYEYPPDDLTATKANAKIDSLFIRGGTFLTYFDFNREGRECIASKYIKGLSVYYQYKNGVTLYRNPSGNIGRYFPEVIERVNSYTIDYNDPDVKTELVDKNGKPVVISKKVKNGLLIVSGLWQFNDELSLKTAESIAMLNLYKYKYPIQLFSLLDECRKSYASFKYDKAIIFSSADSVIKKTDTDSCVTSYLSGFSPKAPVFTTINLFDATGIIPQYISDSAADYYGSGYFMKRLASASTGLYYAANQMSWSDISNSLSINTIPPLISHSIKVLADKGDGNIIESREINAAQNDPYKPLFFIGSTTAKNNLTFELSAAFEGIPGTKARTVTMPVYHDTTLSEVVIPAMLAQENLTDLFRKPPPYDTAKILNTAFNAHLLCDYTALLALEPNDTIKFINNPFDESGLIPVELAGFTAQINGNSVILKWVTITEKNNYGFIIERSSKNNWIRVGFIKGKGTMADISSYTFTDNKLMPGKYVYRIKQVDYDGKETIYTLDNNVEIGIPSSFALQQNYPNPFNPVTTITYSLPKSGKVKLAVYNTLGQLVKELVNKVQEAGTYSIQFDAGSLSSGTYIYAITAGDFISSKKLILMK